MTIQAVALTITASSPTVAYGVAVPAITASYSGFVNGDTAGSLTTQPTCTTSAHGPPSGSAAGTYASNCTGAADANYTISYTAGTVTIQAVALTITASSPTVAYGVAVPAITASYSGFVNGDTAASLTTAPTCTTSAHGPPSGSAAGTYASNCAGAADANYTISYTAGTVTIQAVALTITASSPTVAYGVAVPAITASYSGFVNGDTAGSLTTAPTCTTSAHGPPSGSAAGTYASNCTGAADANYTISYTAGTVTIQAVALTITASSSTTAYGVAIPAVTASYSGFVNGDTAASLSTPPSCATSGVPAGHPVGTYTGANNCTGAVDGNYTISYVAGNVQITAVALTITASSETMAYGVAVPAITASYSGFVNGDTAASLTTPPTCTTSAHGPPSGSAAGAYASNCAGAADANYTISYTAGTVTIQAVALTITASSETVAYGGCGTGDHGQLQRVCERGHGGEPDHATRLFDQRARSTQRQRGGDVCVELLGSGGRELHDQLHGGRGGHSGGGPDDYRQQRVDDLRRGGTDDHAQLRDLCERGHGGESDDRAHLLDERDEYEPGESAPLREQLCGGGGQQLHDELRGGGGDGEPGEHRHHPQSSAASTVLGQAVSFTATVTDSSGGSSGTPAGAVNFYDGGTLIGSGALSVVGERPGDVQHGVALRAGHPRDHGRL